MKKYLGFLLIISILITNPIFSYAMTFDGEDELIITSSSSFEVDEELIGSGLQIQIPAEFNPSYDREKEAFVCENEISVQGYLKEGKTLYISTEEEVKYICEENNQVSVLGNICFGENGIETWTSEELLTGETIVKPMIITIDKNDIIIPGSYQSQIIFSIQCK